MSGSENGSGLTGRRAFLAMVAGVAGVAAGGMSACDRSTSRATDSLTSSARASSPTPSLTPSGSASTSATPAALPASVPWRARSGEVEPAVKARATALVQVVASWSVGGGGLAAARHRVAALGFDPSLADACAPLVGSEPAATARIVDAQYGGILTSSSSVLVVVDQWRARTDGTVHAGGTTLDVRLVRASPHWRVVDAFPAHPGAAAAALPTLAKQVLTNARVRLPYAARADVATGLIASSVLRTLLALADRHVVDVSVVRSGHPFYVFGTHRPSDHPKGHAVDVWALDGKPLVDPANQTLAVAGMRLAVSGGAYNVGGPVLLSGSQYFSDRTHQDHIHLGFRG